MMEFYLISQLIFNPILIINIVVSQSVIDICLFDIHVYIMYIYAVNVFQDFSKFYGNENNTHIKEFAWTLSHNINNTQILIAIRMYIHMYVSC